METVYRTSTPDPVKDRKVRFVISDSSKDRHGTVLNMKNWDLDNFNRNGIVGYQHDVYGGGLCSAPNPDSVIGTGRAWIEEQKRETGTEVVLMGEVDFEPEDVNPLAEKIYRKVLNGTLKATSVGFSPIKNAEGKNGEYGRLNEKGDRIEKDVFFYHGQELLEFSIVNIPSNPNALKRDLRNQTANALQFIKRQLGQDITYGEIEQMKVMDVIRMLETGEAPVKETEEKTVTAENQTSAPGEGAFELRKRRLVLTKINNPTND